MFDKFKSTPFLPTPKGVGFLELNSVNRSGLLGCPCYTNLPRYLLEEEKGFTPY
jgi:hypothetical protein